VILCHINIISNGAAIQQNVVREQIEPLRVAPILHPEQHLKIRRPGLRKYFDTRLDSRFFHQGGVLYVVQEEAVILSHIINTKFTLVSDFRELIVPHKLPRVVAQ